MTVLSAKLWPLLDRLLATLWVGAVWATGFIAAPVLFSRMPDRVAAGEIAGAMFTVVSYLGIFCGTLIWLGNWMTADVHAAGPRRRRIVLAMLVLVVIGQFGLQPLMAELRATGLVEGGEAAVRFGRLHGVASLLYLGMSLLGAGLVMDKR